jgi:hypothetical protein
MIVMHGHVGSSHDMVHQNDGIRDVRSNGSMHLFRHVGKARSAAHDEGPVFVSQGAASRTRVVWQAVWHGLSTNAAWCARIEGLSGALRDLCSIVAQHGMFMWLIVAVRMAHLPWCSTCGMSKPSCDQQVSSHEEHGACHHVHGCNITFC